MSQISKLIEKTDFKSFKKGKIVIKAVAILALLCLMGYLCSHFKEYQRNATNQVNKYRIDQLCLLSDNTILTQRFKAKHTHLKTLRIYSSNDYGGEASGMISMSLVEEESGNRIKEIQMDVKDLINNGYTEFDTDVQLEKGKFYLIRLDSSGTESGKEPIFYQWRTREKGFSGKVMVNQIHREKYLVAKLYYPVRIYMQWATICFLIGFVILLILHEIPLPEDLLSHVGTALWLLAPIFTFWMVERFTDNQIYRIRVGEFCFNLILYYLFFGILYLIFFSRRLSVILGMSWWYFLGIANYYVLNFKGAPILPSDLMSFSTAMSVSANYTYDIQPVFVWNGLLMLCYFALLFRCPIKKKKRWKSRLVLLALILAGTLSVGFLVAEQDILKSMGIKNNVWDQKKGYAKNGLFFGFVLNMNSLLHEKPSAYSEESAKDIVEYYEEIYANREKGKRGRLERKDGKKPNVIAIMNEAFSDLSVVNSFTTNEDYMPFIRSLDKNTIKGNLYMSIFGSGTCNSEFEFLTGNSVGFLQNGIIAYTQVVKDKLPNMSYLLKEQGYGGNLALHPYLASGWNRVEVYDEMGFSSFYSEKDFVNPVMYRKYISDQSDFEKIVELYESHEDKEEPFYLFNVTMQNHGGFDKSYENFSHDIRITDNHANEKADQYLSLIKKSDDAFRYLVKYFKKVEEPTIIVMFGDHQPSLGSDFYDSLYGKPAGDLTKEELLKKYEVPFIIWANYDIKETTIDKMSANYLGAYVMKEAGLKTSSYQKFLLDLYEKLPVINAMGAIDSEGNYYEDAMDSPYKDLVKQYQILQYNNLIDTKHTVDSFFYLNK